MPATRRDLLKLGATGALGIGLGPALLRAQAPPAPPPKATPVARLEGVEKAPRPLRLLILGGTGFTGPHQVRYALARGHRLTLFNRGRRPKQWPAEVEELTGDRDSGDLAALKGREWDACIDNPTTLPRWVRDAGQALQGKIGHYLFVSTISVYASNDSPGADESAPTVAYDGPDALAETIESVRQSGFALYGPLKAASEREAETWFPRITAVIRPGLIVGPGDETDRFSYWPVRLARGGDVLAPGDGSDPVQVIDARDLAEWTIRLAEERAFGAFNAVGPAHELTMAEMLCGVKAATTAGARLHWVPVGFLREQKVAAWADMPAWVPGTGDSAGFARRSNRRALEAGLTFRPLARTALDTLEWFHSLPAERQGELKAGITPEREAAVLAAWQARDKG
jgi:2'-hydroxyisoflavone reductase